MSQVWAFAAGRDCRPGRTYDRGGDGAPARQPAAEFLRAIRGFSDGREHEPGNIDDRSEDDDPVAPAKHLRHAL